MSLTVVSTLKVEKSNTNRPVYSRMWVDRLYKAVKRNLDIDFDFVCFTNDLNQTNVEYHLEPLTTNSWGWWNKLEQFKTNTLSGPVLSLDIDMVICNNITAVIESLPSDNILMATEPNDGTLNSSIMYWNNDYSFLFDNFSNNQSLVTEKYSGAYGHNGLMGDQGYIVDNTHVTSIEEHMPEKFISWKHHKIETPVDNPGFLLFTSSQKPSNNLHLELVKNNWID
jgi:hypothetical protein